MKLFFNESGQIDYECIEPGATLGDLLQAIDNLIDMNPLPCSQCQEGCCKKPWAVEVDNVSVRRLSIAAGITQSAFVSQMLVSEENKYLDFNQYVMKKQTAHCPLLTESNRCSVYQSRPLICRLYSCSPKSVRYNQLREAAAATFLQALVFEQIIDKENPTISQRDYFAKNPALFARDYSLDLQEILDYAADEGWI